MRTVLNVGGNNKEIGLPEHYAGWRHHLLDIDPAGQPDVVCDARRLAEVIPAKGYDAVYCSHNLEHYYPHDARKVLHGFSHVLKDDGFVEIIVPDIGTLLRQLAKHNVDLTELLYRAPDGRPITAIDMIYGWMDQIEQSGEDFFAHKNGFSQKSLAALLQAHFPISVVLVQPETLELRALAFKQDPPPELLALLRVPAG